MVTTPHPSHYPKTDSCTISGTAVRTTNMVTGDTRTFNTEQSMTSPDTDDKISYNEYVIRFHQPTTPETIDSRKHLPDAITRQSGRIQRNNPRILQTQMPTFRGTTDTFSEFEHQLENDLHPMSNSSTEKAKLQYFQTFSRRSKRVLPVTDYYHGENLEQCTNKVQKRIH